MSNGRTYKVLGALTCGMTLVAGLLLALEPDRHYPPKAFDLAAKRADGMLSGHERLFDLNAAIYPWEYILIHDSRHVDGGMRELNQEFAKMYNRDAGYHFVVRGEGRDPIEVSNRWLGQQAGAFITRDTSYNWNRRSIGICLMGDVDKEGMPEDQFEQLVWLVRQLQVRMGIPADRVLIQVGEGNSTGLFPAVQFRQQLK